MLKRRRMYVSGCHLVLRWFLAWLSLRPWRWRRHVLPKLTFNWLHDVISQKTELFVTLNCCHKRHRIVTYEYSHFVELRPSDVCATREVLPSWRAGSAGAGCEPRDVRCHARSCPQAPHRPASDPNLGLPISLAQCLPGKQNSHVSYGTIIWASNIVLKLYVV
jgi:hypothetical protein